jgi:hypothetical protein
LSALDEEEFILFQPGNHFDFRVVEEIALSVVGQFFPVLGEDAECVAIADS